MEELSFVLSLCYSDILSFELGQSNNQIISYRIIPNSFSPNLRREAAGGQILNATGSAELVHSMVCTGALHIEDVHGACHEPLIFPPRKLSNTANQHLGYALTTNLELFLMGTTLPEWIQQVSNAYGTINFQACGDSATSNVKCVEFLFSWLQDRAKECGVTTTGVFTACYLHQFGRLLALHIEQKAMSSALYSVSRLHQHSTTRDSVKKTLRILLQQRFVWKGGENPPGDGLQSRRMRTLMLKLLTSLWDGEGSSDDTVDVSRDRAKNLEALLAFFNGDIMDSQSWVHYCPEGCHSCAHAALQDVSCAAITQFAFRSIDF